VSIVKLSAPIHGATLLRWGSHIVPDCTMFPGEYVRLAPRKWALWLGEAASSKYIYTIPKK